MKNKKINALSISKICIYILLVFISFSFLIVFFLKIQILSDVCFALGTSILSGVIVSFFSDVAVKQEKENRNRNIRTIYISEYIDYSFFIYYTVTHYLNDVNDKFETNGDAYEAAINVLKNPNKIKNVSYERINQFKEKLNEYSKNLFGVVNRIITSQAFLIAEGIFDSTEILDVDNSKRCLELALTSNDFNVMALKIDSFFQCVTSLKELNSLFERKISYC